MYWADNQARYKVDHCLAHDFSPSPPKSPVPFLLPIYVQSPNRRAGLASPSVAYGDLRAAVRACCVVEVLVLQVLVTSATASHLDHLAPAVVVPVVNVS